MVSSIEMSGGGEEGDTDTDENAVDGVDNTDGVKDVDVDSGTDDGNADNAVEVVCVGNEVQEVMKFDCGNDFENENDNEGIDNKDEVLEEINCGEDNEAKEYEEELIKVGEDGK